MRNKACSKKKKKKKYLKVVPILVFSIKLCVCEFQLQRNLPFFLLYCYMILSRTVKPLVCDKMEFQFCEEKLNRPNLVVR